MSGLKISLLGGMEIGPAGGTGEIPITRKTGAMIAYLALQNGHAQTRDKLAGMFWSRNTDGQARTNLRQALSRLRKAMANGDDAPLRADAEHVALDMAQIDLDVAKFESLLEQGRAEALERAVALYRGDLLDGVSLNESAFDYWLRAERERLRVRAVDALLKLIGKYETVSDPERCVSTALRLVSIDPLQEPGHRALMRAYAAQGRHGMALQQFQTCRDLLREELQVEPEAETVALFEDIRQRRANGNGGARPEGSIDHVDLTHTGGRPSVAVLPFGNRGGEDYFAAGMSENIIAGLTRFRDLFVISAASSFALSGEELDPIQAGRRLGVAHVLRGSVLKSDGRVRVTVQLVDARNGRSVWADTFDRRAGDLLAVQDEITANIVASLAGHVEDASRQLSETLPPENMVAYDWLLKARHRARSGKRDDVLEARRLFDRAIELDPSLAAAWAGLAVSYVTEYEAEWSPVGRLDALARAEEMAERAIALDDACAYGHWTLACTRFYNRRPTLAENHIDRAIALNPNEYRNYCVKGWILVYGGKPADGIACALEGRKINPIASFGCHINIGVGEYTAGNYRESIEALAGARKFPNMRDFFLAACHAQLGEMEEARKIGADLRKGYAEMAAPYGASTKKRWRGYVDSLFPFQRPEDMQHFVDGLRKAGLPL